MTKDYLKIVLDGIIHKNESEYLVSYFFREFKVAEKEHYQANEFFNGCLKVAEAFEADIKKQYWDRKEELIFMQNGAEAGTLDTENPKEIIEYCKTELSELSENDFLFQLRMLPMGGQLTYRQILNIKDAISEAFQIAKNETAKTLISEPQQTEEIEQEKHIIPNDSQMRLIFELCQSAIDCDYSTFRKGIETANFEKWNVKRKNFIQHLTYRLSGLIGSVWYSEVCMKMNWTKSQCSGQGKKLENDPQINKLNKILPKPGK